MLHITDGSISYTRDSQATTAIKLVVPYMAAEENSRTNQAADISRSDYITTQDHSSKDERLQLSFASLDSAVDQVLQTLRLLGLNTDEVNQSYNDYSVAFAQAWVLDVDTMNENLQKLLITDPKAAETLGNFSFTLEDECYLLVFDCMSRLYPFLDQTLSEASVSGAEIVCLYGADGILDLQLINVPTSLQLWEDLTPTLDPQYAMDNFAAVCCSKQYG